MKELLPIGRFGREVRLTPRQLRYYHALGLLVPAAVDPGSCEDGTLALNQVLARRMAGQYAVNCAVPVKGRAVTRPALLRVRQPPGRRV